MNQYGESLEIWKEVVNDPSNHFVIQQKPGTILAVNNWRVLHGNCLLNFPKFILKFVKGDILLQDQEGYVVVI